MTVPPPPGSTPPPPPPMPPGPPQGGPPPMGAPGPAAQSNGAATASLVLGILSCLCPGFILAVPAIIFGFVGKKKAEELGGEGKGQATAGLVLGFIGIALSILLSILFFAGVFAANSAVDDINDEFKEANKEYTEQQARNLDEADPSDYTITNQEQDPGSYGYVTYSGFIENNAEFDTGYTISVTCEGDQGDVETSETYVYNLATGDKEKFSTSYSFDENTTSVDCEVTEVLYGY